VELGGFIGLFKLFDANGWFCLCCDERALRIPAQAGVPEGLARRVLNRICDTNWKLELTWPRLLKNRILPILF
jgi:hypothetical protein